MKNALLVAAESGDTIDFIASRHGVSREVLLRENPGVSASTRLQGGEQIALPAPQAPSTPAASSLPRLPAEPAPSPEPPRRRRSQSASPSPTGVQGNTPPRAPTLPSFREPARQSSTSVARRPPPRSSGGGPRSAPQRTQSTGQAEATAMRYFRSQGYSQAQAAGIVGNLIGESGLNPTIRGDNGRAYGIGQWHPDRQAGLRSFARRTGGNPSDLQTQLAYVHHELTTSERAAGQAIRASRDVYSATHAMTGFERPQGWRRGGRAEDVHGWSGRYGHASRLSGGTRQMALGGDLGGTAGALAGQALIPIPGVGSAVGQMVGGMAGNLLQSGLTSLFSGSDGLAVAKLKAGAGNTYREGGALPNNMKKKNLAMGGYTGGGDPPRRYTAQEIEERVRLARLGQGDLRLSRLQRLQNASTDEMFRQRRLHAAPPGVVVAPAARPVLNGVSSNYTSLGQLRSYAEGGTIQAGQFDTLEDIAKANGLTWREIRRLNPGIELNIRTGQTINIGGGRTVTNGAATPVSTPAAAAPAPYVPQRLGVNEATGEVEGRGPVTAPSTPTAAPAQRSSTPAPSAPRATPRRPAPQAATRRTPTPAPAPAPRRRVGEMTDAEAREDSRRTEQAQQAARRSDPPTRPATPAQRAAFEASLRPSTAPPPPRGTSSSRRGGITGTGATPARTPAPAPRTRTLTERIDGWFMDNVVTPTMGPGTTLGRRQQEREARARSRRRGTPMSPVSRSGLTVGGTRIYAQGGNLPPEALATGAVPIGQDAAQFVGPSHANGGIPIPGVNAEVEGGETVDKVRGSSYVFSKVLKVPGTKVSFAEMHMKLVKNGASEQEVNQLASMQEKTRGTAPGKSMAGGGELDPLSPMLRRAVDPLDLPVGTSASTLPISGSSRFAGLLGRAGAAVGLGAGGVRNAAETLYENRDNIAPYAGDILNMARGVAGSRRKVPPATVVDDTASRAMRNRTINTDREAGQINAATRGIMLDPNASGAAKNAAHAQTLNALATLGAGARAEEERSNTAGLQGMQVASNDNARYSDIQKQRQMESEQQGQSLLSEGIAGMARTRGALQRDARVEDMSNKAMVVQGILGIGQLPERDRQPAIDAFLSILPSQYHDQFRRLMAQGRHREASQLLGGRGPLTSLQGEAPMREATAIDNLPQNLGDVFSQYGGNVIPGLTR